MKKSGNLPWLPCRAADEAARVAIWSVRKIPTYATLEGYPQRAASRRGLPERQAPSRIASRRQSCTEAAAIVCALQRQAPEQVPDRALAARQPGFGELAHELSSRRHQLGAARGLNTAPRSLRLGL